MYGRIGTGGEGWRRRRGIGRLAATTSGARPVGLGRAELNDKIALQKEFAADRHHQ